MMLTRSFLRGIAPCVVACVQALAAPGVAAEPAAPVDEPAIMQIVPNPHDSVAAKASYLEWKKRLYEARAEGTIGSYKSAAMQAAPVLTALYTGPHPRPA